MANKMTTMEALEALVEVEVNERVNSRKLGLDEVESWVKSASIEELRELETSVEDEFNAHKYNEVNKFLIDKLKLLSPEGVEEVLIKSGIIDVNMVKQFIHIANIDELEEIVGAIENTDPAAVTSEFSADKVLNQLKSLDTDELMDFVNNILEDPNLLDNEQLVILLTDHLEESDIIRQWVLNHPKSNRPGYIGSLISELVGYLNC